MTARAGQPRGRAGGRQGVGFGRRTAAPGAFYDFRELRRRTPDPADAHTRMPG